MSKKKYTSTEMKVTLKEDWVVVVPKGTVLLLGSVKRTWGERNFEHVIGVHKNGTAYLTLGQSDIETRPDLFEVTQ